MAGRRRRIRVLIVDDHPLYRRGLADTIRRRPELELVGEAADGRTAVAELRRLEPDVALVDVKLPDIDGLDVLRAVRDQPQTRIIMLSGNFDTETAYDALAAGAAGCLSKDEDGSEICMAIEAAARGETVLGLDFQAAVASAIQRRAPGEPPLLSEREHEVLRLTADGLSAPDIAGELHLATSTVKTHLQHVYGKLGVSDRAAAVAEAMRRGLLR